MNQVSRTHQGKGLPAMTTHTIERMLRTPEVAHILGVSRPKVAQYAAAGLFRGAYRNGGPWYIPESAIPEFIEEQKRNFDRRLRTAA